MRKASIRQNHEHFEEQLDTLEELAAQIAGRELGLDLAQSDMLAEGLVLTLAGHWEEVVVEDFVDGLNRDTNAFAKRIGLELPKNLSRDICFGLLVGDGYLDFRSTGDIVGRAKQLLVDNPFDHMTRTVRKSIDQLSTLRNYLAHRSQRAYRRYRSMLEEDFGYKRIVRPGVFLRARGDSLGNRRLEFFVGRCREASEAIRSNAAF